MDDAVNPILEDYLHYERINAREPGFKRINNGQTVKYISDDGAGAYITAFLGKPEQLADAIEAEKSYFRQRQTNFEWKTYACDGLDTLEDLLMAAGFQPEEEEAFMVMDLEQLPAYTGPVEAVKITTPEGIDDVIAVEEAVWDRSFSNFKTYLLNQLQNQPDYQSLYVSYQDGKPVATARITFTPGSPFAGLWGGSTLKEFRGLGHYRSLLHARAEEARLQGVKYLTLDASDMSEPIVTQLGFDKLTTTRPYHFHFKDAE